LVFVFQAEASGKSQMAIDKMVEGRLRKYFEDVVLMDQKFVMNDTMKVKVCEVSLILSM
jgi:translation elongation factor EF-Ts